VVFPRLLGWVSTIVNRPTQHRRGRLDTAFSYEKAYETILTLNLTKQALRQTSLPISLCIVHYLGQRYIFNNRHGNTSGVYSPNLGERVFCELRPHRVLRSSAPEFGSLDRQKGDVVLLLPPLSSEGVEFLHQ
jgi:hypothetical protein